MLSSKRLAGIHVGTSQGECSSQCDVVKVVKFGHSMTTDRANGVDDLRSSKLRRAPKCTTKDALDIEGALPQAGKLSITRDSSVVEHADKMRNKVSGVLAVLSQCVMTRRLRLVAASIDEIPHASGALIPGSNSAQYCSSNTRRLTNRLKHSSSHCGPLRDCRGFETEIQT